MPKYKVVIRWTEIQYYTAEVEVEADNENDAEALAIDARHDYADNYDCEEQDIALDSIKCLDEDDDITGTQPMRRNLPKWF